jgi:histidine triad (HIT) family protein
MNTAYDDQNIFAKILRGELPAHKIAEDEAAFAFMDIMPRSDGHVLVIPKAPARNIFDIAPESLSAIQPMVKRVAIAARKGMEADGLTILQANETAGGQVVFHLHIHVLPRWAGVPLRKPGAMAEPAVLAANADKIRSALA